MPLTPLTDENMSNDPRKCSVLDWRQESSTTHATRLIWVNILSIKHIFAKISPKSGWRSLFSFRRERWSIIRTIWSYFKHFPTKNPLNINQFLKNVFHLEQNFTNCVWPRYSPDLTSRNFLYPQDQSYASRLEWASIS